VGHWKIAKQFDNAIAPLLGDVKSDGLLNETLVVCMGEFGRVPGNSNSSQGRDRHAQYAILMAGGGVQGGLVLGSTDKVGNAMLDSGSSRKRDIRPEDVEAPSTRPWASTKPSNSPTPAAAASNTSRFPIAINTGRSTNSGAERCSPTKRRPPERNRSNHKAES